MTQAGRIPIQHPGRQSVGLGSPIHAVVVETTCTRVRSATVAVRARSVGRASGRQAAHGGPDRQTATVMVVALTKRFAVGSTERRGRTK